jgi:hypothetical protein
VRKTAYLKFLDELVLPFVILGAARYLGFFAATYLRPIQFSFGSTSDLVSAPFLHFNCSSDRMFANSISWFFVAAAWALFFGFVLFRNLHFHQDWVHPRAVSHLHNKNLEFLIIERSEAFYQSVSWFFLTGIFLILAAAEFLAGNIAVLVFGTVWGVGLPLLAIFLIGLARDWELVRKKV